MSLWLYMSKMNHLNYTGVIQNRGQKISHLVTVSIMQSAHKFKPI